MIIIIMVKLSQLVQTSSNFGVDVFFWGLSADEILRQPVTATIFPVGFRSHGGGHQRHALVENVLSVTRRTHPEIDGMTRQRGVGMGRDLLAAARRKRALLPVHHFEPFVVDLIAVHHDDVLGTGAILDARLPDTLSQSRCPCNRVRVAEFLCALISPGAAAAAAR